MSISFSYAASPLVRHAVKPLAKPLRKWPFLSPAFSSEGLASTVAAQTFYSAIKPKAPPSELETDGENDGLALPVEPDEGTVLIPDDERVINVPS